MKDHCGELYYARIPNTLLLVIGPDDRLPHYFEDGYFCMVMPIGDSTFITTMSLSSLERQDAISYWKLLEDPNV